MKISKFNLTFDEEVTTLFPLPSNNQYQEILNLRIVKSTHSLKINSENQIAIFPAKKFSISFKHRPLPVNKNIDETIISQVDKKKLPKPDEYFNYKDPEIKELAEQWLIPSAAKSANDILTTFYKRTIDFLTYGNPTEKLYTYKDALDKRITDCGGFATFLGTLLMTQGIPCRLVVGHLYKLGGKYKIKQLLGLPKNFADISMHAWLEVLESDGSWFPVDPAVEWKRIHGKSKRLGGFGHLPADRLVLSYGYNHYLKYQNKNYQFTILQHPERI